MTDIINDSQLKELFFTSAQEYLDGINTALLSLESNPTNKPAIENIFRATHSLKSESLSMGYSKISELCHTLEDLFSVLREGQKTFDKNGFNVIYQAVDFLENALLTVKNGKTEPEVAEIKEKLLELLDKNLVNSQEAKNQTPEESIFKPKLDSIKVNVRVLDHLMNITEELFIEKIKLSELVKISQNSEMENLEKKMELLISELQYYVTQLRLTPLDDVFQRLPRVIRDLADKLNKKVNVTLDLGNLKVDRYVAEAIYEPILHMIKNSLDHGFESPEERKKLGKSEVGSLNIRAYREQGLAIIEVSDDGRGFDLEKLKEKWKKQGIKDSETLSAENLFDKIAIGGISTSEKVTDISGRGVGLNVVKTVMEKMGGKAKLKFVQGKGTTFALEFPFSLAIIQAMLVKVSDTIYAVPVSHIDKTFRLTKKEIQEVADVKTIVEGKNEVLLISLAKLFNQKEEEDQSQLTVVQVKSGKKKLGFIVNKIVHLEEIVVKPFSIKDSSNYFSGVTIIGSNKTALIIDVEAIIHQKVN